MKNRKNEHLGRCVLCLTLVLLLCITGCTPSPSTTGPSQSLEGSTGPVATAPSTAPATVPTQPTTQPTTQPATQPATQPTTQPTEPPVDPNLPVYELTQEDVDEFYRLLEECEALSLLGEDMDAIDAATEALDAQYEYIGAQCSISLIRHYSDTSNETLEQQYLDCFETYSQANNDYIEMSRRVYQSDSPAKEELFAEWSEADIAQLLAYEEEVALLQQRNAEIEVEYMASTSDDVRIPLYIEFVQNNNKIAQTFGYENYYTYAYSLVYNRDYSSEELEKMRQFAGTYLIDVVDDAFNNFQTSFYNGLEAYKQNKVISFLYNDYTSIYPNYVDKYLSEMPKSMQTHMNNMLTADSYFATSPNAKPGAFTTMIGDRSYCFFGPGYANNCTVIHEAGHYYASRYADLNSIPLDLAETHSQGNEWLFICSLADKMPADQYKAMLDYRMYYDIAMILACLMVDEFEQQVYSVDVSNFTAADFDAIMENVCLQYCSLEYAADYLVDLGYYWRQVVVMQPVYYISYGVSSVAAIDLYTMALEDFDAALAVYQALCEQPHEDMGFLGNISAAGLSGPFQEEFYKEIVEIISSRAQ